MHFSHMTKTILKMKMRKITEAFFLYRIRIKDTNRQINERHIPISIVSRNTAMIIQLKKNNLAASNREIRSRNVWSIKMQRETWEQMPRLAKKRRNNFTEMMNF